MARRLEYWEMPKAIQNLVDGWEFLARVERVKVRGRTAYKFVFQDSFETWARFFDGHGNKLGETPYLPRIRNLEEVRV